MPEATFHFPHGFLWGTATSSYQVEGNNINSNWWGWEQESGHILNGDKSGLACDWWGGHWRDDFDRIIELGNNSHRLSIEWSRIQPLPDRWDETAIDRYRTIVRGLIDRGIIPMVALHHFSDPIWLADFGGWEEETAVNMFKLYVDKVVEAFNEYANTWITFNEPNVFSTLGYLMGIFPPGKKDVNAIRRVIINIVQAHAYAYHAIHRVQPRASVGITINYRGFVAHKSWFPLDRVASLLLSNLYNDIFPRSLIDGVIRFPIHPSRNSHAKGTLDFLGINYFTRDFVKFDPLAYDDLFVKRFYSYGDELSDTGFIANVPEFLFKAIKWGLKFQIPLIITENGVENSDDKLRRKYLVQHIHQVWRAINFNFPVKGYYYWTLVDNFEWERGWSQRFGLYSLDINTQTRIKRPSADLFAEVCKNNCLSSDIVSRYSPEILEEMFP